ncbi:MAG: galactose-1-phosphate uridylyltransferase [Candidatus Omnitrophica bacterium]|nr:galactose-1-phosphate uridylyltransferase [Candidatus Omnitrophota bacterium]
MPELRREPIVGRWVVIKTDPELLPGDFEKEDHAPHRQATCPFCAGKENLTPPEIEAVRSEDSKPNGSGWKVRAVPNKFPALKEEGAFEKTGIGMYDMTTGIGAHEIIIETPDHQAQLPDLSLEDLADVLDTYISRAKKLAKQKRFKYICLFKNFGESAGGSIEHAHSQVIALPMVPKFVVEELEGARNYFRYRGRCIFCDMIHQEHQDKERIIVENSDFLSFCPFAPRYAFETWIIPKKHASDFTTISSGEKKELAKMLKDILGRIRKVLSNPAYNFFLHVAPNDYDSPESYHWHIEIIPKLTHSVGFEWGTGLYIVPTSPGAAARCLRDN